MSPNLVFVGFHGAPDRSTSESQNELIAALLADDGYHVRTASAQPRQLPRLADQLRVVITNLRWADVVVACEFSGRRAWTTFFLTRVTRRWSIPTVLVLRGGSLPTAVVDHPRLIDSTLGLTTRIIAPSAYLQRAFEARGHRVQIVPNFVRAPIVSEPRTAIGATAPAILWMRAFHATYQPELAVSAFAQLLDSFPGARLTMAGPDSGRLAKTRQLATSLGVIDRITFPGYLEGEHKAQMFRDHDLFLNTTLIDNTPVSVIEAMGAGLPVVATDVGGLRDLARPEKDALLVPDGDPVALADAMERIITKPDLADRLRQGGRAIAERHGVDQVRRRWREILSEVGAPPAPAPTEGCAPASVRDVDRIAALHIAAFPDSALTALGPRVVRRYYRWQFSGPHPHPVAIGAWRGGELAGFVVGGSRHEAVTGFVRTSPGTLLAGAIAHPSFLRRVATSKIRDVARAMRHNRRGSEQSAPAPTAGPSTAAAPTDRSFGILSIAVDERQWGTGVAGELLDAAEHDARERGFSRMNLSVNTDNPRAVCFYEKHGWQPSPASPWDGKMSKTLISTPTGRD